MTMLPKLALAAFAAVLAASPVFAQSFDPVPFGRTPMAKPRAPAVAPHARTSAHRTHRASAPDAFAMEPRGPSGLDPNDPALTGGGSLGYNRMLLIH